MMIWHILGSGAIGCLWAVQLHESGHDVRLVVRSPERLAELNANQGVTYTDMDGKQIHSAIQGETADNNALITHLIVTTKAFATLSALDSIKHRLTPETRVLLLQNGMGQQYETHSHFPELLLWAASTTDGAYLTSPFNVVRAGRGETLYGQLFAPTEQSQLLPEPIGDLRVNRVPDIEQRLWCKVAINAVINPLTAINDCKNGELLDNAVITQFMEELCQEIELIASAAGQPLFDEPLYNKVVSVASQTASNYSSMLQDIRHQRPTEIEQISGFLCQSATKTNTPAPLNQALLAQIRLMSS